MNCFISDALAHMAYSGHAAFKQIWADMMSEPDASQPIELSGRFLIAMPGMEDPRFAHSVVLLCDHSAEGAMGIVINKPSEDVDIGQMLGQLSIDILSGISKTPVHFGGPVEMGRGFVLHSPDYKSVVTTLEVLPDVHMTATLDILEDIGAGKGPDSWLMALGYAGWGPGQLEAEIAQNGWLVCEGTSELVFATKDSAKWEAALDVLGIGALALSAEGGHA